MPIKKYELTVKEREELIDKAIGWKDVDESQRLVISSRDVAKIFEKSHSSVIRSINSLECSTTFAVNNFVQREYKTSQGNIYKEYLVTKDGFMFLGMGFTGEVAAKFKELLIDRYNYLEEEKKKNDDWLKARMLSKNGHNYLKEAIQYVHGDLYYMGSHYTNIVYRALTGMDARHIRIEMGLPDRTNIREYLTEEVLNYIKSCEDLITRFIYQGWNYDDIRDEMERIIEKEKPDGISLHKMIQEDYQYLLGYYE